jgi:hypothetical protein
MATQIDAQSVGRMVAVTPSDTARIQPTIGLSVYEDGDVSVLCVGNDAPVVRAVLAGVDYPWRVKAVYATGTTATGIVALYQD